MAMQYVLTKAGVMRECAILTNCKATLEKIRGLKKPTETIVNIRELIQEAQAQGLEVTWYWVKAHKKNKGNERADELAKQAADDEGATVGFNRTPTSVIKTKTKAELRQKWQASGVVKVRWQSRGRSEGGNGGKGQTWPRRPERTARRANPRLNRTR